jgi:pyruvate/2-oxoglutarate dehydrogenase complex dihydrolipoamide acyltransferase (E2) component
MATTLIDTRKSIMDQIHASWNEYRRTEEGMIFMFGDVGSNYRNHHDIPLAKDFTKDDAPWSTKQSVLERNAVHANKLIRLYISLNIDVAYRVPIWQFFEIQSGVVGRIKDEIKLLKRIQKVLKLEQELEIHEPLPNATSLFTHTAPLSLTNIEDFLTLKVKEAKAAAKAEAKAEAKAAKAVAKAEAKAAKALAAAQDKAAAKAKKLALKAGKQAAKKGAKRVAKAEKAEAVKEAKKLAAAQAKAAKAKAKKDRKFFLDVVKQVEKNSIAAEKLGNKLAKKTIALLKWAQANDFELEDIVNILESEVEAARSDNNMVTIIDIA